MQFVFTRTHAGKRQRRCYGWMEIRWIQSSLPICCVWQPSSPSTSLRRFAEGGRWFLLDPLGGKGPLESNSCMRMCFVRRVCLCVYAYYIYIYLCMYDRFDGALLAGERTWS